LENPATFSLWRTSDLKLTLLSCTGKRRDRKTNERQISWDLLLSNKEKRSADFIAVVAPHFARGDLIERSLKHEVASAETETHHATGDSREKPLDVEDLKELF